MEKLSLLFNILKVAVGLGFVIFLHELGHFLLAKWNGVKVEKFSVGFGPTLLGFTKGETEYVLAAVPLGGFVKMLGEGPDEEVNKSSDPRAFLNKSVGARMAIISAGVIMNLILGLACFVYAYKMGMDEVPTRVGAVVAGGPAYQAGLCAGDEIVAMDGRGDLNFQNVQLRIRLSGEGQVIRFDLKRHGQDEPIHVDIEPRREPAAEFPGIGILPSYSLLLARPPYTPPAGLDQKVKPEDAGLKPHDKIVAVGPVGEKPEPVSDVQDFYRRLTKYRKLPLNLVVERTTKPADDQPEKVETITTILPPDPFVDFGFRLKIEPIVGIRNGSPAEKAGFHKGDRILSVDGETDFDPMQLPTYCFEHAGSPVTFEIERGEADAGTKVESLTVTPDAALPWTEIAFSNEPLDVPGLGLAYTVRTKVEAVKPDTPAAKAGIKAGDVINTMTFASSRAKVKPWRWPFSLFLKSEPKPDFRFDDKSSNWAHAFQVMQYREREPILMRVNNADEPITLTPAPDFSWYRPIRGENLQFRTRRTPPMTMQSALRRGWDDSVDNILNIYAMFRSLAQLRVSPKNLGGPILIGQVAYEAAVSGLTDFIHFLGILSINLAVLNFLPIPPLDGGQMVFLIAEKVRGRPLPEAALAAGTWLGVIMVIMLMAFVMYQDVLRLALG